MKHFLIIIFLGFVFYCTDAIFSTIFFPELPQDDDWCINLEIPQTESDNEYCKQFKNEFEQLKYYHNLKISEWHLYFTMVCCALVMLFSGYIARKNKNSTRFFSQEGAWFAMGVLIIYLPFIFNWILPPPIEWFPKTIKQFSEARKNELLLELKEISEF